MEIRRSLSGVAHGSIPALEVDDRQKDYQEPVRPSEKHLYLRALGIAFGRPEVAGGTGTAQGGGQEAETLNHFGFLGLKARMK
jgi:hypothetical protein